MAYTSIPFRGDDLSGKKKRRTNVMIDDWDFRDLDLDSEPISMAKIKDSNGRVLRIVVGCEDGNVAVVSWPKGRILAQWSSGIDSVTAIHLSELHDSQEIQPVSAYLGTKSGRILSIEGSLLHPNFIRYLGNIGVCCQGLRFIDDHLLATSDWRTIRIPLESSGNRRQIQTIFAV